MNRATRWVMRAVGVFLAFITFVAVFFAPFLDYVYKSDVAEHNLIFCLIAVVLGLLTCVVGCAVVRTRAWRALTRPRAFCVVLALVMVGLVVAQTLMFRGGFFRTGWDLFVIADLDSLETYQSYFQNYPNQCLLLGLFELVAAPMRADGTYTLMGCYERVAVIACVCVDVSVIAVALAARKAGGHTVGYATLALLAIMCGLSPWVMVPYTDALGMLCPSLVLASYACVRRPPLRAALVGCFGTLGYFVKPTAIFVVAAILAAELLRGHLRQRFEAAGPRRALTTALAFVLAAGVGFGAAQALSSKSVEPDSQQAFGVSHYLMMGANAVDGGGFSADDVHFAYSYPNASERNPAELARWKERVVEMGPVGCARLLVKKACSTYADGTFGWRQEGGFFTEMKGSSDAVTWWYGIDPDFTAAPPFSFVVQPLWLMILLGCVACAFARKSDPVAVAALLSVVMLAVFLSVFECRARYLFLYAPVFCLAAVMGWREVGRLMADRRASVSPAAH